MAAPSVVCRNVTLAYRRHPAVHHLSGRFAPGSYTAVVGPNGAGKSTLLKGIMGTIRPDDGAIAIEGIDRRDIAYLPQIAALDRGFPMRVLDLAAMGLWRRKGPFARIAGSDLWAIASALQRVGLAGFEERSVGSLSGGQFQRALFARLLLQDSQLILLDEPFGAIDTRTTDEMLALIGHWHAEGRTIIAVLHDLEAVKRCIPETLLIARDPVAWGPTGGVLTEANIARSRGLVEAFDEDAAACERPAA